MLDVVVGGFFGFFIMYAAVTKFTTLAAITQMGSIQERSSPWADQSRKPKKGENVAEKLSSTVSRSVETISGAAAKGTTTVTGAVVSKATSDPMEQVRMQDKIVYTASIINALLTSHIFSGFPQYFYMWHSPKAILYTAHRWYTFKQQNQHYLLYDFCYWANALSLVYCWLTPENDTMFRILFLVSNGPLAWAVLAFSQSLIFHSAPHMTSVFIHTSPMLLSYATRWYPNPQFKVCSNFPDCDGDECSVTQMLWDAHTKFYLWWVALYYLWVYVIMNRRVQERGYKTLFDRVSNRGPTKFLKKISDNEHVQKVAYLGVHVIFATLTMLLSTVYWRSQTAHMLFIVCILSTSAWNASGFYFTVFANRYADELKERVETIHK